MVGSVYGMPLASILRDIWQETFLVIGYIGLILIIFEGGLSSRVDPLKQNFFSRRIAATTSVIFRIG